MILVVGATGYMGRETVRQLLAAGMAVRAMTRTPEKAGELKELGAEVVQGDLIDHASLARACQGVDGVVAAAHQLMGSGKYNSLAVDDLGHRALIDAAKAAGVKHFVFASMMGASPDSPIDFVRTKYAIEQYLIASGLTYTILRGPSFMEWHAHNLLGKDLLEKGKTTIMGRGDNPVNFISTRDMGTFAVIALTDLRARNQIINTIGPDNCSKNQVAEMYIRFSNKPAQVSHMPRFMLRVMGVLMKPFKPELARVIALSYFTDVENQAFDPRETLEQYPVKLMRLEDFVKGKVAEMKG
jgi:uncharacterized protein YbjT (DUF2867 family)